MKLLWDPSDAVPFFYNYDKNSKEYKEAKKKVELFYFGRENPNYEEQPEETCNVIY